MKTLGTDFDKKDVHVFGLKSGDKHVRTKYIEQFEYFGEVFVIYEQGKNLFNVAHKETGFNISADFWITGTKPAYAKENALEMLDEKGAERLKKEVQRAREFVLGTGGNDGATRA